MERGEGSVEWGAGRRSEGENVMSWEKNQNPRFQSWDIQRKNTRR